MVFATRTGGLPLPAGEASRAAHGCPARPLTPGRAAQWEKPRAKGRLTPCGGLPDGPLTAARQSAHRPHDAPLYGGPRAAPRGRRSNCRPAGSPGPQAGRPRPPARRKGGPRSARGTGRLRPPFAPRRTGGAKGGAEGPKHGHHLTGPIFGPEHLRGERPGRSRAGEKARPRSARRAWPCLFDGRRKRPHRCPAGPCGSIKRGRGVAWPPYRRRQACGCGGGHDRRSRAGSAPHGGPRYRLFLSAPRRQQRQRKWQRSLSRSLPFSR